MEEEGIKIKTSKNVFYNTKMHFCRSISSLAVGAIKKDISIVDGFSATGVRGLRYLTENKNVRNAFFVDVNKNAIKLTKQNLKISKLKGTVIEGDFNQRIRELKADLIEIDPFGTPVPYLYDSIRSLKYRKEAYSSITATDVAVLCGPHSNACLKNYHSKSLNNEFTHETGLRILLKRISETLTEFNFGLIPLFSLSDQHYLKVFAKIKRGDKYSLNSVKNIGFVSFCNSCGERSFGTVVQKTCKCRTKLNCAGPLWIGELHNEKFLKEMKSLNKKRNYKHKEKINKILDLMLNENNYPPYFYDLHQLSRIGKKKYIPKISDAIGKLKENGFSAAKTHFSPNSIKTNAKLREIMKILYP